MLLLQQRSLCGCQLHHASVLIGLVTYIYGLIQILESTKDTRIFLLVYKYQSVLDPITLRIAMAVIGVTNTGCSISLIIGVVKEKSSGLLIWIAWQLFLTVIGFVFVPLSILLRVMNDIPNNAASSFCLAVLELGIQSYLLILVYSLYRQNEMNTLDQATNQTIMESSL